MDNPPKTTIDVYATPCLQPVTVFQVCREAAQSLLTDPDMPLIAVPYQGVIPKQQRSVSCAFLATPTHLGYLAGILKATIDRLDHQARATYTSNYDTGHAWARDANLGKPRHVA